MTVLSSFYVLPFLCNCVLVSTSMLTPLKADGGLRIFKDVPGDLEYVLKRHNVESRSDDSDSKERRSSMGSSFIRFGRSDSDSHIEKVLGDEGNAGGSKVNRYPRWKSPDIVIRFGRSDMKAIGADREYKRGRNGQSFIRFGRGSRICTDLLPNDETVKDLYPYEARLLRLCNVLTNMDPEPRTVPDFLVERVERDQE